MREVILELEIGMMHCSTANPMVDRGNRFGHRFQILTNKRLPYGIIPICSTPFGLRSLRGVRQRPYFAASAKSGHLVSLLVVRHKFAVLGDMGVYIPKDLHSSSYSNCKYRELVTSL